jgi:hypothetical protein
MKGRRRVHDDDSLGVAQKDVPFLAVRQVRKTAIALHAFLTQGVEIVMGKA